MLVHLLVHSHSRAAWREPMTAAAIARKCGSTIVHPLLEIRLTAARIGSRRSVQGLRYGRSGELRLLAYAGVEVMVTEAGQTVGRLIGVRRRIGLGK